MELRQIRYFLVLAEELNFSRAAERLHITQPPLTRQIQQLEDELGTVLFLRTPRHVELTAAGRTFLEEARKILSITDRAVERTQKAHRGELGRIDVGIYGSAVFSTIPRLLLTFRTRFPSVDITLHTMDKIEQVEALRDDRITIGFARIYPREPDITVEHVMEEAIWVAAHASHPLAAMEQVPVTALNGQPMILFPNFPRPSLADEVIAFCRAHGFQPKVVQEASDTVSAIALVSIGFGVALVPEAATNLHLPGLVYRPLEEPALNIGLSCAYRQGDVSPTLKEFLRIVRSHHETRARTVEPTS